MKILVTSGSTKMPIDNVRIISNIFKGTTGAHIAWTAAENHDVTLIANNNVYHLLKRINNQRIINIHTYETFDELEASMKYFIMNHNFDVIIHSAAVSDYKVAAVCDSVHDLSNKAMGLENRIDSDEDIEGPYKGKIKSGKNLYIAMIPTKKLVDQIRKPWGFKGTLVKFKLQVGTTSEELIDIANKSLKTSSADFIVANDLYGFDKWSENNIFIINSSGNKIETSRSNLPKTIIKEIESLNNA